MRISGIVFNVEEDNIFSIIKRGKKEFYYMRKNTMKKYSKYLKKGVKVIFDVEKKEIHHDKNAYVVEQFILISKETETGVKVFYDLYLIQKGISKLLNTDDNLLFIDFEMNMQDFKPIPNFYQEIIEAGYVLCNKFGAIKKIGHMYIKPTQTKFVTKRTMEFLSYTKETLKSAATFTEFYEEFCKINEEYNPQVFVWGKSDITTLKKCVDINKLPHGNFHFIDLLQLHINYFNLKTSPGLFETWSKYYGKDLPEQTHDSLEDALITKDVYFKFRSRINKRRGGQGLC